MHIQEGYLFFFGSFPGDYLKLVGFHLSLDPIGPVCACSESSRCFFFISFVSCVHLQYNSTNHTIHWSCPMGMVIWGWSMFWTLVHDTIHLDMFILFYTYDLYMMICWGFPFLYWLVYRDSNQGIITCNKPGLSVSPEGLGGRSRSTLPRNRGGMKTVGSKGCSGSQADQRIVRPLGIIDELYPY